MELVLPTTILLCGKMGTGKTFVGQVLAEDYNFVQINFADAVKEEVAAHLGISLGELNARKAEYRPLLQRWGTEYRRAEDPNYWVKEWARRRALIDGPVVATDCRFPNEALHGIEAGALVLRVAVAEDERVRRMFARDGAYDPSWMGHQSEQNVSSLPVHAEIPGDLCRDDIAPFISHIYNYLAFELPARVEEWTACDV